MIFKVNSILELLVFIVTNGNYVWSNYFQLSLQKYLAIDDVMKNFVAFIFVVKVDVIHKKLKTKVVLFPSFQVFQN